MAKLTLTTGTFSLIPTGEHIFKITKVDYDSKSGLLEIYMQTKSGLKHKENYHLKTWDGEVNEKANNMFSYFAKNALNDFNRNEIDSDELVGCYISATVSHETYTATKGKNVGKEMKSARLHDYAPAYGFGASNDVEEPDDVEDDLEDDLDDDLDDLD